MLNNGSNSNNDNQEIDNVIFNSQYRQSISSFPSKRDMYNYIRNTKWIKHGQVIINEGKYGSPLNEQQRTLVEHAQFLESDKIIFIHLPKCAGSNIEKIMGNRCGYSFFGHCTIDDFSSIIPVDEYFKFTVVRNPWDRLVSAYFYLMKKKDRNGEHKVEWHKLGNPQCFRDFVIQIEHRQDKLTTHVKRYSHYLKSGCKWNYDFACRLESLDSDIEECIKLCPATKFLKEALSSKSNTTSHEHYSNYYDDRTRKIVEQIYSEDIEHFGYSFEMN